MTIRDRRFDAPARIWPLAVLFSLYSLSACGQTQGLTLPTGLGPRAPYMGLETGAYGPLSTAPIVYCDPAANMPLAPGTDFTTGDLASKVTGFIAAPFAGGSTIDDGIAKENLQHNFAIPGDVGQANVALIESTDSVVSFWHTDVVRLPEVQAAAAEYCARRNSTAVYRGSAAQCPLPQTINQVRTGNNQPLTVRSTYIISSFTCTPAPAGTAKPTATAPSH